MMTDTSIPVPYLLTSLAEPRDLEKWQEEARLSVSDMRIRLSRHKMDVKESSKPDAENDGSKEEALELLEMLLEEGSGSRTRGDAIGVGYGPSAW
jgi:hypothetical protein